MSDPTHVTAVTKTIAVFGDVAMDWFLERVPTGPRSADSAPHVRAPGQLGWRMHVSAGGALLLAKRIELACTPCRVISAATGRTELPSSPEARHLVHGLARVEVVNPKDKATEQRLRIVEPMYYSQGGPGVAGGCGLLKPMAAALAPTDIIDALVLDDADWGFRGVEGPPAGIWPSLLETDSVCPLLLLKLSGRLDPSPLLDRLAASAWRFRRRVVVVTADDLRTAGLDIARRLSWDSTVADLLRFSQESSGALHRLRSLGDLIVRLDLDGTLVLPQDHAARPVLVCEPGSIEGDYGRMVSRALGHKHASSVIGTSAAFAASVTAALLHAAEGDMAWETVLALGLTAAREVHRGGMRFDLDYPNDLVLAAGPPSIPSPAFRAFPVESGAGTMAKRALQCQSAQADDDLATRFALRGAVELAGIPHISIGSLLSADPAEIEQLRYIADLFERHLAVAEPKRPLCLGVFGRPGSGKSFAVKEIAVQLAPDELRQQEVNLAQLSGPDDLMREFHIARDTMLDGKTPLVFFDEFDCATRTGKAGWLPFFLAPMQDGTFRDQGRVHSIRRAIFVFAGGTKHSFKQFAALDKETDYEGRKVPDFVSRLQGALDVQGPDCTEGGPEDDPFYRLRRAMLLRSLLLRMYPGLKQRDGTLGIASAVLRAFLGVAWYEHGARSIEALIKMSAILQGSERYEVPMLPPDAQIELHANPKSFRDLLLGRTN